MDYPMVPTWRQFKALVSSTLYANSAYLVAANAVSAGFGFLFWTAAARLYRPEDVGLAAGAVSGMNLLVMMSALGLDYAMIRFLPHDADSTGIINTALTIGASVALALSVVFLAGLGMWSPSLLLLRQNAFSTAGFIVAAMCMTISVLLNAVFLTRMRSGFVLAQSAVFGMTKVVMALVLATAVAGLTALVCAWAAGTAVAIACGLPWFLRRADGPRYRPRLMVHWSSVRRMTRFASANYISAILAAAPLYVMPLLVLNLLGPEANAYYYVAASISSLLAVVPTAVSMALFAHGSQDNHLSAAQVLDGFRFSLGLLVPAIASIFLLGGKVLLLFGRAYSEAATHLLWLLSLATLPMALNVAYFSVRRVQHRMTDVLISLGWILVVTFSLSAVLLPRMGLIGAGAVWLAAQSSVAATLFVRYVRRWGDGFRDALSG
jgi:O-antigen/teichoic acid export membrane protein